jgi:hypothetical protein
MVRSIFDMDNFVKLATNRNSLKSLVKDFYIDELERFSSEENLRAEFYFL